MSQNVFPPEPAPAIPLGRSLMILSLFPVLIFLTDLFIRYPYLRVLEPSILQHYLYSFFFEWLLAFLIIRMTAAVWKGRIWVAILPAALLSVMQLIIYGHYFYFGVLPNPYSIKYLFTRSADSFSLMLSSISWMHAAAFTVLTVLYTMALKPALRVLPGIQPRFRRGFTAAFIVMVFIFNNNVRFAPASYSVFPATIFSAKYVLQESLSQASMEVNKGHMRRTFELPERPKVKSPYNCILFISESLRKHNVSSYGYRRQTTPFIDSMIAAGSVVRFHHHVTNAVSTQYSVPILLSGAFTIAGMDRPFIYDYLRRWTDTRSFFFTAQSMERSNMDLVFNTSLDRFVCQETMPFRAFNDLGADDADVAGLVHQFHDSLKGERFFSIIQFNNTHFPYTGKEATLRFRSSGDSTVIDRYDNAIREQDDLLRSYFRSFGTAGLLDSTVIVFTSDHGEAFGERGHMGHLNTLYAEEVEVPMWIYLPPGFPEEKRRMIERNALKTTSHLDLVPTLMELNGIIHDEGNEAIAGASLLRPLQPDRVIPIVGKDMIDTKAVIIGPMKYIQTVRDGIVSFEAYDLVKDRSERHNLWEDIPEHDRRDVQERLAVIDNVSTGSMN
jgi:glucan phosphoethanolaminetransferase (alkaline phosphatase superfamily)